MRGNLVRNLSLFEVPNDLTYFVHDEDHLVVNPEVAARCVLSGREFRVLQALAAAQARGSSRPWRRTRRRSASWPSSS